jgi:hypothetical protein
VVSIEGVVDLAGVGIGERVGAVERGTVLENVVGFDELLVVAVF